MHHTKHTAAKVCPAVRSHAPPTAPQVGKAALTLTLRRGTACMGRPSGGRGRPHERLIRTLDDSGEATLCDAQCADNQHWRRLDLACFPKPQEGHKVSMHHTLEAELITSRAVPRKRPSAKGVRSRARRECGMCERRLAQHLLEFAMRANPPRSLSELGPCHAPRNTPAASAARGAWRDRDETLAPPNRPKRLLASKRTPVK